MKNLFKESKVAYLSPPEKPRGSVETAETAKVEKLGTKFYSTILKGNAEKAYKSAGAAKQKAIVKKFLLKNQPQGAGYIELGGGEDPITGFASKPKYKDSNSNWVSYEKFHKLKNDIHAWCNKQVNVAKIKNKIRTLKATPGAAAKARERRRNFTEKGFPSRTAANKTTKFFISNLQKLANKLQRVDASKKAKITPGGLQKKLNSVLNPVGANIGKVRANFGMDEIKFNGPLAWKNVKSPKRRRRIQERINKVV